MTNRRFMCHCNMGNYKKGKTMKKLIILFVAFVGSVSLLAQEPLVKFYILDGTTKQYKIADVDSIGVIDNKNNYVMRIHYRDTLVAYYPTEIIGSIKFGKDTQNRQVLNVYIFTYPKSYLLHTIDSIIFYIDKYQPLTIGSQVWMLKNLNVDHYRNGDTIPEVRDSSEWANLSAGAWCYYNNSDSLGKIYGKLYNWFTVNDSRGLAPAGWHVPSDTELYYLSMSLGYEEIAGGKLKESGYKHWIKSNSKSTNSSGFTALPGGSRGSGYIFIGYEAFFWSSTGYRWDYAWCRKMGYDYPEILQIFRNRSYGFSVRCVKDK